MRPYYYCIMTLLLLTSIALSRPAVLGDGAAGPPEQKDQEQTQNPTASGNPPGPVPGSRSRLLCDGNNNNHLADGDISQYPLYESKTHMKANGFAAFNVAYNIVKCGSRTFLCWKITGPGELFQLFLCLNRAIQVHVILNIFHGQILNTAKLYFLYLREMYLHFILV